MWRSVIRCYVATMQTERNAKNASTCKRSNSRRTRSWSREEHPRTSRAWEGVQTQSRSWYQTLSSDAEGSTAVRTQAAKQWQRSAKAPASKQWEGQACFALHLYTLLLYACIRSGTRRVPVCITPHVAMFQTKTSVFASTESILLIYVTTLIQVFELNIFYNTGQPENVCFSNYETFPGLGLHS